MYGRLLFFINAESEIVGLASQFATQNCLGCYSKLNLGSRFHAEVATHLPRVKLRALYLEYYIILIATQLLQIATSNLRFE